MRAVHSRYVTQRHFVMLSGNLHSSDLILRRKLQRKIKGTKEYQQQAVKHGENA